jgi:Repeat of unknown function (DUF5648)
MGQQKGSDSLYLRRQFFKKALVASSVAALGTLTGLSIPDIAHASSVRPTDHKSKSLASNLAAFYRLYNSRNGDHFYTTDRNEADNAVRHLGYNDEGIACYVLRTSFPDVVAFYRLYNQRSGDHFYTSNREEADRAASQRGYNREGIACYVFPVGIRRGVDFSIQLYRLYNPRTSDHFYTTDRNEADNAVSHLGYRDEGIAAYVL